MIRNKLSAGGLYGKHLRSSLRRAVWPASLARMKELFQHSATTDGVTVRVAVNFLPEQSRIEAGKWFWVYHIRIENDTGGSPTGAGRSISSMAMAWWAKRPYWRRG